MTSGSFGQALVAGLRAAGEREVLVRGTRRLTGEQVYAAAQALAARLADEGVTSGDTVACLYGPHPESPVSRVAAYLLDCRYVYLLSRMRPDAVETVVRTFRPSVLMVDPSRRRQAAALRSAGLAPHCLRLDPGLSTARPTGWAAAASARRPHGAPDRIASVVFSSGTTGPPKPIAYSNRSELAQFATAQAVYGTSRWRFLVPPGPFVPTLMAQWAMATGGTAVLPEQDDAASWVALIRRERVRQCAVGLPPDLFAFADHLAATGGGLGDLEVLVYGGASIAPARMAPIARRLSGVLRQIYGTTEAALIATLGPPEHRREELLGSVGRPAPGTEVKVCDADGAPLPPGRVGHLWVRSAQNMDGYVDARTGALVMPDPPLALAEADVSAQADTGAPPDAAPRPRPGWLPTGDAASLDRDGHLFLAGRLSDRLPSGAYPQPIENSLCEHPAVAEAAVHALSDGTTAVVVVPRPGHAIDLDALRAHLDASHPPETQPRHLRLADALPRTPTGKLDRREVAERFAVPASSE
ncbi:class I adenylate-forming enzyme family protein [Actinomadura logoneensis]|uniref:class I adenylate-forming enzyme family protein n=1 Tax=Actinomadura logoneensis TaxID=2293572 RepID=UPI001314C0C4|nr:fatty acid--CoA ligase family protein [Actinomadura logoneensis]